MAAALDVAVAGIHFSLVLKMVVISLLVVGSAFFSKKYMSTLKLKSRFGQFIQDFIL